LIKAKKNYNFGGKPMPLKLRISLGIALITSSLTLLVGLHNSITLTAMVQRTLISLVCFAILGYVCGQFAERLLREKLEELETKDTNIESVADGNGVAGDDGLPAPEFEPLNAKDFENITLTQK
jgi:tetrahydromethanopterin S-methyltransferase subunit C